MTQSRQTTGDGLSRVKRVNVSLYSSSIEQLDFLAELRGQSRSALIAELIREEYDANAPKIEEY